MGNDRFIKKIALGTVQFGLNYGIKNNSGQIPEKIAYNIMDYAFQKGIDTLDTAYAYGTSEKVIGNYLRNHGNSFNVISKYPTVQNNDVSLSYLDETFNNLGINNLYAYIFHDYSTFKTNQHLLDDLVEEKVHGRINKIGFSLYYPSQLEDILNNKIPCDIIQIPYNILDKRFDSLLNSAKNNGIEIHVRSIFLQGLLFISPENLSEYFTPIKKLINNLNVISRNADISISAICLCHVVLNKFLDKIVIGVDSVENLLENIDALKYIEAVRDINSELDALICNDENFVLPFNWKK